jgi:hypothetical protein
MKGRGAGGKSGRLDPHDHPHKRLCSNASPEVDQPDSRVEGGENQHAKPSKDNEAFKKMLGL